MPNIDLSILNQRQTPAFYASSLATRPAFGFAGRIFIDTDSPSTGLYRDTGSAWVQIADPGAGTTGTLQQVTTNGNTTTLRIIGRSFQGNAADGDYFLSNEDVEFRNQSIANSFRLVGTSNTNTGLIYFGATGTNYFGYDGTNLVLNSSVSIPSLTTGSVPFIAASGLISQDNANLFYDATNGHFGIGTNTPGTALDVKHNQNTVLQLEQEVATNDNRIAFINSGVGLWRLGAFYNSGANDFGLFDIAAAAQPVTVKRTTGQVLIGTSTVGSGKLVVASSTGDNGVQIVGAAAPSLRIDNAESGPTKRAGLGISTATNNFIQGSADRDFCIFNGSTTASPILFGIYDTTNVAEAARISAARNFLIGTTTDSGYKLDVTGTIRANGNIMTSGSGNYFATSGSLAMQLNGSVANDFQLNGGGPFRIVNQAYNSVLMQVNNTGNILIGTTTDNGNKLQVSGGASLTGVITQNGVYTSSKTISGTANSSNSIFSIVYGFPGAISGTVKVFAMAGIIGGGYMSTCVLTFNFAGGNNAGGTVESSNVSNSVLGTIASANAAFTAITSLTASITSASATGFNITLTNIIVGTQITNPTYYIEVSYGLYGNASIS